MRYSRFSVITISLNRRDFLQKAIESVVRQGYPNYEHIVIDGGSTDGTTELLQRYSHLQWISEADRGQAHALNKGIRRASGEICAWLNSDDMYPENTFYKVNQEFAKAPNVAMMYGKCILINEQGEEIGRTNYHPFCLKRLMMGFNNINTPATFTRVAALKGAGEFNEALRATYDVDMWIRIAQAHPVRAIDAYVSYLRLHGGSGLVCTRHHVKEMEALRKLYWTDRNLIDRVFYYPALMTREWLFYRLRFARVVRKSIGLRWR